MTIAAPTGYAPTSPTTILGNSTDDAGTPTIEVEISGGPGGNRIITCTDLTPGDGAWVCPWTPGDLTGLSQITLRARGTDSFGNVGGWSLAQVLAVDITPPTVLLNPNVEDFLADGFINGLELLWRGQVVDDSSAVGLTTCPSLALSSDCQDKALFGGAVAPWRTDFGTQWVDEDGVPHDLALIGQDDAGNLSTTPLTRTFIVDTVAPVITVTVPISTVFTVAVNGADAPITGTITDGGGVVSMTAMLLAPDGQFVVEGVTVTGESWAYLPNLAQAGEHLMILVAWDRAGNATFTRSYLVQAGCRDVTGLESSVAVTPGDDLLQSGLLTATITRTAGINLPAGIPVRFSVDGTAVGVVTTTLPLTVGQSVTVTLPWAAATPGDHRFTADLDNDGSGTGVLGLCQPVQSGASVSIQDLALDSGWNLVSSYVTHFDTNIDVVQRTITETYATIQSFDGETLTYYPNRPGTPNSLSTIDARHGYWIKTLTGTPLTPTLRLWGEALAPETPLALQAGWNLVSYLPRVPLSVTQALASIAGRYTAVLAFDHGAGSFYPDLDGSFNTAHTMTPGFGYWIQATEAVTLTYPSLSASAEVAVPALGQAQVAAASQITATHQWMNFYGPAAGADEQWLPAGTVVQAVDPQGVICGVSVMTTPGQYGLLACYGDDADTGVDEGAQPGDTIRFVVDGVTLAAGEWTGNRQRAYVPLGAVKISQIFLPLVQHHDVKALYLPMLAKPQPATATPTPAPTPNPTAESGGDNLMGDAIAGLLQPSGVAVHQGQNRLFLTSQGNKQLLKVNPAGNGVEATAATGDQPWGVAVNEITNRVYVSNYASADVWVYDADTLARVAVIKLGNPGEIQPGLMVVLPDLDTVAVTLRGVNGVAFIQGLTLGPIIGSGGVGPFGLAVDAVGNRVFVSNRDGGNMRVLYHTEFGEWKSDGQNFTFGDRRVPFQVEYNPVNQKLYLLYVVDMAWSVDVWETRTDGQFWKVATVPVGQSGSSRASTVGGLGLAADTATGNVFVTNSQDSTVSVIDGRSNQVTHTLSTGPDPFRIAVNSVTRMVYVVLRAGSRLAWFRDVY